MKTQTTPTVPLTATAIALVFLLLAPLAAGQAIGDLGFVKKLPPPQIEHS